MDKGKRRRRKIWLWVRRSLAFVSVTGLGVGLYFIDHPLLALQANGAESDWRAAGLPWVAGDVGNRVPDGKNAVFLIRKAEQVQHLSGKRFYRVDEVPTAKEKMEDVFAEAANGPALDLLVEASRKEGLFCNANLDKGNELVIPEHNWIFSGARLLIERANSAESRPFESRLADLEAVYRLSELVEKEGLGCGYSHRLASMKKLIFGVAQLVNNQTLSLGELKALDAMVGRWEYRVDLSDLIPGEAFGALTYLRNCPGLVWDEVNLPICVMTTEGAYTPHGPWTYDRLDGVPAGVEKRGLFVRASRLFTGLKRAAKMNEGDLMKQGEAMDAIWKREAGDGRSISRMTLSYLTSDGYASSAREALTTQFLLAALKSGVRAKLAFAEKGGWPDFEKISEETVDPLSGEGCRVRMDVGVLKIYILGRSKSDDGGPSTNSGYQRGNIGILVNWR